MAYSQHARARTHTHTRTRTHTHAHTRTQARTHARTRANLHARVVTRTRIHIHKEKCGARLPPTAATMAYRQQRPPCRHCRMTSWMALAHSRSHARTTHACARAHTHTCQLINEVAFVPGTFKLDNRVHMRLRTDIPARTHARTLAHMHSRARKHTDTRTNAHTHAHTQKHPHPHKHKHKRTRERT